MVFCARLVEHKVPASDESAKHHHMFGGLSEPPAGVCRGGKAWYSAPVEEVGQGQFFRS